MDAGLKMVHRLRVGSHVRRSRQQLLFHGMWGHDGRLAFVWGRGNTTCRVWIPQVDVESAQDRTKVW